MNTIITWDATNKAPTLKGKYVLQYSEGSRIWFLNDTIHREDGPAVEWDNGSKEWWINGELHRENGPAIEHADGTKEYWVNGKELGQNLLQELGLK